MIGTNFKVLAFAALLLFACDARSNAQTIGYAEAMDRFAVSCSKDIDKYCKNANLAGGRVEQCLDGNQTGVSGSCKTAIGDLRVQTEKRAVARATVMGVCEVDLLRLCSGIQPDDGSRMECLNYECCLNKVWRNTSAQCQRTVVDAGYDVSLGAILASGQIKLNSQDLINRLQGVEASAAGISAASLRQLVAQGIRDPSRANRMNREPLSDQLGAMPQLTIAVQFDSARIRPDSFRAIGLMADALYHPYLQGYRFLIVGHTDAKGNREYNLKLSQLRADAIREALIDPFGISPFRIGAVGLGEEQLLNRTNPEAAENLRVQLINIGK